MVSAVKSDNPNMENDGNSEPAAEYLQELSIMTVRMEKERTLSLTQLSASLLTSVSIVSVALLAAAPLLFSYFATKPLSFQVLRAFYIITFLLLVLGFFFSVLSQVRLKYQALPGPEKIKEQIEKSNNATQREISSGYAATLEGVYSSVSRNNDVKVAMLQISMWLVIGAIVAILIGGIIIISLGI